MFGKKVVDGKMLREMEQKWTILGETLAINCIIKQSINLSIIIVTIYLSIFKCLKSAIVCFNFITRRSSAESSSVARKCDGGKIINTEKTSFGHLLPDREHVSTIFVPLLSQCSILKIFVPFSEMIDKMTIWGAGIIHQVTGSNSFFRNFFLRCSPNWPIS